MFFRRGPQKASKKHGFLTAPDGRKESHSGFPGFSRIPKIRISENPKIRISGIMEIRISGNPEWLFFLPSGGALSSRMIRCLCIFLCFLQVITDRRNAWLQCATIWQFPVCLTIAVSSETDPADHTSFRISGNPYFRKSGNLGCIRVITATGGPR